MSIQDIANALVAGCREGTERANLKTLYATDATSVEAFDNGNGREAHGLAAIEGKHDWFESAMEVIEQTVSDPMLHGEDRFAVIFEVTAKDRESGAVIPMQEVAIYTVTDGKISREEFFYQAPPS
ncbi:MAG: nuclear transport factor 2 family protein [Rhodobacteraceae bacterium]|nr:nuclear transport factor 2 family protein [Paracoccaceae bacterium]